MSFKRTINTISMHAEGAHNEVIVGGIIDMPGTSMFEKARYMREHRDDIRQFLLHEPRGKVIQCVNLVLPSAQPGVDAGFIIMESEAYPPMSGTNTMSTVTALLESGLLPMKEPFTDLVLEAPGGLIKVRAHCSAGQCTGITIENVPCFVFGLDIPIRVEGLGEITVDIAYGGMIYVVVDAAKVGADIAPQNAKQLVNLGERIKHAAATQFEAIHPENPEIHTVNQTLFAGPIERLRTGEIRSRNTVVVSPGRLDRSPCGTGTSARLAVMHDRGEIGLDEPFLHDSIVGTTFTGRIVREVTIGNKSGIVPTITGRAWVTGFHTHVLSPTDPLPVGYRLNDTWPMSPFDWSGDGAQSFDNKQAESESANPEENAA